MLKYTPAQEGMYCIAEIVLSVISDPGLIMKRAGGNNLRILETATGVQERIEICNSRVIYMMINKLPFGDKGGLVPQ